MMDEEKDAHFDADSDHELDDGDDSFDDDEIEDDDDVADDDDDELLDGDEIDLENSARGGIVPAAFAVRPSRNDGGYEADEGMIAPLPPAAAAASLHAHNPQEDDPHEHERQLGFAWESKVQDMVQLQSKITNIQTDNVGDDLELNVEQEKAAVQQWDQQIHQLIALKVCSIEIDVLHVQVCVNVNVYVHVYLFASIFDIRWCIRGYTEIVQLSIHTACITVGCLF
jgi:hypothetical protein